MGGHFDLSSPSSSKLYEMFWHEMFWRELARRLIRLLSLRTMVSMTIFTRGYVSKVFPLLLEGTVPYTAVLLSGCSLPNNSPREATKYRSRGREGHH